MSEPVDNLILRHLERFQAEQAAARERDLGILSRLLSIGSGIARPARDQAGSYTDIIQDRQVMDKLKERVERIERRLDIVA